MPVEGIEEFTAKSGCGLNAGGNFAFIIGSGSDEQPVGTIEVSPEKFMGHSNNMRNDVANNWEQ
jgi:hypothetical protein